MGDYSLLIDFHKSTKRQGPGGDAETELALNLSGADHSAPLNIADIGCGTGASTLLLAQQLNGQITAVDFLQEFLEVLEGKARNLGVFDKITTHCCSMEDLPFNNEEFDLIWSEGAIYNIGFERGIKEWKRYLKPGGLLVVSEITWISDSRPAEIQSYWEQEYPEIDTASSKFCILEKNGYSPVGYFVLGEHCWLDNYYRPLENGFKAFLDRQGHSEEAKAIIEAENHEIEIYERYKSFYSYGVYIAKKVE